MALQPGNYIFTADDQTLCRYVVENLSLMPKQMYLMSSSQVQPYSAIIEVGKSGETYTMKLQGGTAGFQEKLFVAYLLNDDSGSTELEIKQKGNGYIIALGSKFVTKGKDSGFGNYAEAGSESAAIVFKAMPVAGY